MISEDQKTVYTCGDGTRFFTRDEAENYEMQLQVTTLLQGNLNIFENPLDKVANVVIKNLDEINKIVRDYK